MFTFTKTTRVLFGILVVTFVLGGMNMTSNAKDTAGAFKAKIDHRHVAMQQI